jgi:PAS domain S-box-containing protein
MLEEQLNQQQSNQQPPHTDLAGVADPTTPSIGGQTANMPEPPLCQEPFQATHVSYSFLVLENGELVIEWGHEQVLRLTGYSDGELHVSEWCRIVSPDDLQIFERCLQNLFSGAPCSESYRIITKQGEVRWLCNHSYPMWDAEQQRTTRIYGVIQDISAYQEAEIALRRSEERYRTLASNFPNGVVLLFDHDLRYTLAEGKLLVGSFTKERVIGKTIWEVFHSDIATFIEPYYRAALVGETGHFEMEVAGMWFRVHTLPIYDECDTIVAGMVMTQNITEQRNWEHALREQSRKLATLMRNIPGMAYRCANDGQWTMEFVSAGSWLLTGYQPSDLIDNAAVSYATLIHPEDRGRVWETIQSSLRTRRPFQLTYRILPAYGPEKWVWEQGSGIFDDDGHFVAIEGLIIDITEQKYAQDALRESEERFRQIAEHIRQVFWIRDESKQRMIYISPAYEEIWGRSRESLYESPMSFMEAIHPDDIDRVMTTYYRYVHESRFNMEYRIVRPDGSERWVWARSFPIYNEHGTIYRHAGIAEDITERKLAEDCVRRHAARVESLVHTAARLNAQLDVEAVLQAVCEETNLALGTNVALISLYNTEREEMVFSHGVGISPEDVAALPPIPRAVIDPGQSVYLFTEVEREPWYALAPTLVKINAKTLFSALVMRDEELVGVVVAITTGEPRHISREELLLMKGIADQAAQAITNARLFDAIQQERTLLAQRVDERTSELSKANAELSRAVRAKDEFLANMSHELRTPLNAILGLTESLQEYVYGTLNERQLKTLGTVESSGRHLLDLINDILDLAKIEAGKMEIHKDTVTIDALCDSSIRFIKQMAAKKQLSVSFQKKGNVQTLQGDVRRLKQILVNLLSNAVKFTPKGGSIGIEAMADKEEGIVHFVVWDTGIGIDDEQASHLFKPFVQLDSKLSRQHVGTGLGLALVSRLSEMHGGSVTIESEVGKGSRFTISLPIGKQPEEPHNSSSAADGPANVSANVGGTSKQKSTCILLAEDNESNIELYSDYLTIKGFRVVVARNGQEAIDRALEIHPDIILMDIQMPGMDGLEAMTHIRAHTAFRELPIVALTALAMPGDRERCFEAGANEYMSKPVSLRGLLQTIQSLLGPAAVS